MTPTKSDNILIIKDSIEATNKTEASPSKASKSSNGKKRNSIGMEKKSNKKQTTLSFSKQMDTKSSAPVVDTVPVVVVVDENEAKSSAPAVDKVPIVSAPAVDNVSVVVVVAENKACEVIETVPIDTTSTTITDSTAVAATDATTASVTTIASPTSDTPKSKRKRNSNSKPKTTPDKITADQTTTESNPESSVEVVEVTQKKKRVRKATTKSKDNEEVSVALDAIIGEDKVSDSTSPIASFAPVTPIAIEWKPDAYIKLKYNLKRIQNVCNEFNLYEYRGEHKDLEVNVDESVDAILQALEAETKPKEESPIDINGNNISGTDGLLVSPPICPLKSYMGRVIQGSTLTLNQLSTLISTKLIEIRMKINTITNGSVPIANNPNTPVATYLNELLSDSMVLKDEIKQIAKREEYGYRIPQCCIELLLEEPATIGVAGQTSTNDVTTTETVSPEKASQSQSPEDSPTSLYRWETHLLSYFPTHINNANSNNNTKSATATATATATGTILTSNVLNEIRSIRGKFSRLIKAIGKLIDQLVKDKGCMIESKMIPLDARIAKCVMEIEKYKERVRESDRKKLEHAAELAKKEQVAEMKRKEKEEILETKRREKEELQSKKQEEIMAKQAEKEKEKLLIAEKEAKKVALLNKQKNLLFNFVKLATPPVSTEKNKAIPPTEVIVLDGPSGEIGQDGKNISISNSTASVTSTPIKLHLNCNPYIGDLYIKNELNSTPVLISTTNNNNVYNTNKLKFDMLPTRIFDPIAFQTILNNNQNNNNNRHPSIENSYKSIKKILKTKNLIPKRKPIYIPGTVVISDNTDFNGIPDAFNNNPNYTEVKDFAIDPFMKNLKFYEDIRPAYCGSFSKGRGKKTGISGRRPFYRDEEIFNYDYDSEADWDEEDVNDGEDIAMSDGEDSDDENNESNGIGGLDLQNGNEIGIEYDEFYRPDSDYGSDIEDENEVLLIKTSRRQQNKGIEVERCGPCFITCQTRVNTTNNTNNSNNMKGEVDTVDRTSVPSSSSPITNSEPIIHFYRPHDLSEGKEKDEKNEKTSKLLNYGTVFYPNTTSYLPVIGQKGVKMKKEKFNEASGVPGMSKTELKRMNEKLALESAMPKLLQSVHGSKEGIDRLVVAFCGVESESKPKSESTPSADGSSTTIFSKALIKRVIMESAVRKRGEMMRSGCESVSISTAPTLTATPAPTATPTSILSPVTNSSLPLPTSDVRIESSVSESPSSTTPTAVSVTTITASTSTTPSTAPSTPTMERFGSHRWSVHEQLWEKYCIDKEQPILVFTPPRIHKNGKRRIDLMNGSNCSNTKDVSSAEKEVKKMKTTKTVKTGNEVSVTLPINEKKEEKINTPVVKKKEKKRIAPILVTSSDTVTPAPVPVAPIPVVSSAITPAKKEKKRIAPVLISTPIAIATTADTTPVLTGKTDNNNMDKNNTLNVMTLESGEEVALPKQVYQSNTLSMFMNKHTPTHTPANTPIKKSINSNILINSPSSLQKPQNLKLNIKETIETMNSKIKINSTNMSDKDEDDIEEIIEIKDEYHEYYDGCNEDSNAGMLIISC